MGVGSSVPMGCEAVVEEEDEATSGDGWRLGSGELYLKLLGVLWLSVGCIGGLPMEVWETRDLCLGMDCAREREEVWDPRVGREQVQRSTCSHSPCKNQAVRGTCRAFWTLQDELCSCTSVSWGEAHVSHLAQGLKACRLRCLLAGCLGVCLSLPCHYYIAAPYIAVCSPGSCSPAPRMCEA